MSGVGNCYDNAVAESFFGTLKTECVTGPFRTHTEARTTLFEYLEVWYNRQRIHSTLGYYSPVDFETSPFNPVHKSGGRSIFNVSQVESAIISSGGLVNHGLVFNLGSIFLC